MDNVAQTVEDAIWGLYDEATPESGKLYAVKVVFTNTDTEETRSIIAPWVSYNAYTILKVKLGIQNNERVISSLAIFYNRMHLNDPGTWLPTAAKIVTLHEAPF